MANAPKKKKTDKKPTPLKRHELALKVMWDNVGNPQKIKEGLIKLGYSESTIRSARIQATKSWDQLIEQKLSDEKLTDMHEKLLNKKSIEFQIFPKSMPDESIKEIIEQFGFQLMKITKYESWKRAWFPVLDTQAIKAALDMAYKLKKKYGDITIGHKFDELSNKELEGEIAGTISEAIGAIARKKKTARK